MVLQSPSTKNLPIDVALQDQTTLPINRYLSEKLKTDILTTAQPSLWDEVISVSPGHGFTGAGEWIEIIGADRIFQAEVKSVSTNDITLYSPISFEFPIGTTVYRTNVDMAVNGSVTPKIYTIESHPFYDSDLTQFIFSVQDTKAMDAGTYGGIAALTNGTYFSLESDIFNGLFFNARRNGDVMERTIEHHFSDKGASSSYAFEASFMFGGQENQGVVVRLLNSINSMVKAVIRDDLTTLVNHRILALGHRVQP